MIITMLSLSIPKAMALVFFFWVSMLILSLSSEAAVVFLTYDCPNTTTFTPNGTYQRNRGFLLSSFVANATRDNGFYNLTVGRAPDTVYGLFLCRGDVTIELCQECVTAASKEIVRRCPKERVSIVIYDECMLRYSNESFFNTVQTEPNLELLNTQNVSQPEKFMQLLGRTMNDIAGRAADDQSGKKFATEIANFTSFQSLYTLAQCTPDLSMSNCERCLQTAISYLPGCCNGKQGGRVLFPSCNVRYELYPFYRIVPSPPPPRPRSPSSTPVLPSSPQPGSKGKKKMSSEVLIAIFAPVAVSVVLVALGFCFLCGKAKKKYDAVKEESAVSDITTAEALQFDLGTIEAATNNFSDVNKLGQGGFGQVYKGILPNRQEIAVKRLSRTSGQGTEEFKSELVLVSKLQHRNLVRMLGFCLEGEEKLLVYEFVPNKSLDYFIFDPEKRGQLDWSRRYKIIEGIARGILYLHEDSQLRIIHRDLKASNILLDGDMNPKVSDFGMARIFEVDQTHGSTNRIAGTFGYMAPEYAMHGQFSVKSDVYSFGVLLLEIITGKKSSSFNETDGAGDLLNYAWNHWNNGTALQLLDPSLREFSYSRNEVIRCIQIGLLCVEEDPVDRPTMATVVLLLSSYSVTLQAPRQPVSIFGRGGSFSIKELGSDQSPTKTMQWSVNEATISQLEPR